MANSVSCMILSAVSLLAVALPAAADDAPAGRGKPLAEAQCADCHSTRALDNSYLPELYFAGGRELKADDKGNLVRVSNITPDPETGIGTWSDADIKKATTEGITPTGGHLAPLMPFAFFHGHLPADDLDAIVAYLRTVPPIKHKVERTEYQLKNFP